MAKFDQQILQTKFWPFNKWVSGFQTIDAFKVNKFISDFINKSSC